jgi:hypothetical protein
MIQVSLVGYMSAGSFLGLQYFDLFYHLIVIAAIVRELVSRKLGELAETAAPPPSARMTAARTSPLVR